MPLTLKLGFHSRILLVAGYILFTQNAKKVVFSQNPSVDTCLGNCSPVTTISQVLEFGVGIVFLIFVNENLAGNKRNA